MPPARRSTPAGAAGPVTLRPLGARIVAVTTWVVAAGSLAITTGSAPGELLRSAPFLLLICWVAYLVLWRPLVRVDSDGVELVNVLRRVRVPYAALREVQTRWALTLFTDNARYVSWAATASPRRHTATNRSLGRHVIDPTGGGDSIRSSAAPESSSGAAALAIAAHWQPGSQSPGSQSAAEPAPEPLPQWDRLGLGILLVLTLTCLTMSVL